MASLLTRAESATLAVRGLGGQIRRTTDIRIFLLQTYAVVYSFTASAFHTDRPSVIGDPMALVKLAIPSTI